MSDMTAFDRGMQLFKSNFAEIPILAIRYARELSNQVGMCGEVMLTAFCMYAEVEEGLPPSPDKAYTFEGHPIYVTMRDRARASSWKPVWWDDNIHPINKSGNQ